MCLRLTDLKLTDLKLTEKSTAQINKGFVAGMAQAGRVSKQDGVDLTVTTAPYVTP